MAPAANSSSTRDYPRSNQSPRQLPSDSNLEPMSSKQPKNETLGHSTASDHLQGAGTDSEVPNNATRRYNYAQKMVDGQLQGINIGNYVTPEFAPASLTHWQQQQQQQQQPQKPRETNGDTSFINSWDYVAALEDHNVSSICDLLYSLIKQFLQGTIIFIIIDSISRFDIPAAFPDLAVVIDCLLTISTDPFLGPALKVLLTNPTRSKPTLTELVEDHDGAERLINLHPNNLGPTPPMSDWAISRQLMRHASSPECHRKSAPDILEEID
ncbi:hypothetical protein BJY04DRAFT_212862 [Aspergillus karnatakaensis]|uniref:uncharacterized protein n=1 Tax=Aspergillus karnatakaensis TaxID=1810916 RepID=UPI003CCD8086